jgi:ferredoxin
MADKNQKVEENVAGRFYVDATCIDCDLCRETAPRNFVRQDEGGYSYVAHQPQDPAEEAACLAAMEECPVEAIGDDGERSMAEGFPIGLAPRQETDQSPLT